MAIRKVLPGQSRTRFTRSPQFDVSGALFPHAAQVMCAFPILPGETITRMRMKNRVMSHPVASPLSGAHYEVAAFYVKLSDLSPAYRDWFTSTGGGAVPTEASARPHCAHEAGDTSFIVEAYDAIAAHYMADGGETVSRFGANGPVVVKRDNKSWFNNLGLQFAEATIGTKGGDVSRQLSTADIYRLAQMEETKFEDYLEQYGVSVPPQDQDIPEMFYYSRAWSMPRNSVEPTTGVPASAWAWQPAVDMQKRIRCREPGFIVVLHWVRPKLYLDGVRPWANVITDPAAFWLPPGTLGDPLSGSTKLSFSDLPVASSKRTDPGSSELIYDRNDLYVHGEQWRVNALGVAGGYAAPVISPSFNDADIDQLRRGQYPTQAEMEGLFTGLTAATRLVEFDGLVAVDIQGHVQDHIE